MGKQQSKGNHFCHPLCSGRSLEDVVKTLVTDNESGTTCDIPLFCLTGVVLVPGQTLPLHLFQSQQMQMIQRAASGNNIFGIVTESFVSPTMGHVRSTVGTTVQIQSVSEDTASSSMKVKGVGCQRFQVVSCRRQADGTTVGSVRMLVDKELPPLLDSIMLSSQRRLRVTAADEFASPASGEPGSHLRRKRKVDNFSAAVFTHWPSWVYKQYDTLSVMKDIRNELASCNDSLNESSRLKEPVEYSFWLMANLPMDDQLKLSLLSVGTTIQRLRCELGILKSCTVLCCKDCGLFIAEKADVFSMARGGPLGMYVNPGGYVHELITVYRADGLKTAGGQSTENTWFEGYAWIVAQCRNCTAHVGWKFVTLKRGNNPGKFWGVCRSAVLPGIKQGQTTLETDLSHLTL